jgi:hypothetical protein
MGGPTEEEFLGVLDEALELFTNEGLAYAVIGGIATTALLDSGWNVKRADLDFLITERDAERILELFAERGFSTKRKDSSWIYKAARPDVTIDLIFRASGDVELDDDLLERIQMHEFERRKVATPCAEDLLVTKVLVHNEESSGHWFDSLRLLQRFEIDWDYLQDRSIKHGPRRMLSFLLYAQTDEMNVPDRILQSLWHSL